MSNSLSKASQIGDVRQRAVCYQIGDVRQRVMCYQIGDIRQRAMCYQIGDVRQRATCSLSLLLHLKCVITTHLSHLAAPCSHD